MSRGYTNNGKRLSSMTHAKREHVCTCGKSVHGNGGKSSHRRACPEGTWRSSSDVYEERKAAFEAQRVAPGMKPGLAAGVNVDHVDIAAGVAFAAELGFAARTDAVVVTYALQRHQRGEEAGAERTWLSYFPHDLTSWRMILARAVTAGSAAAQVAG